MQKMAKKLAFAGLFTAAAVLFGYVEFLIPLDFIAPGVKLGLANGVALYLICLQHPKWALAVNVTRILVSTLLFSNPFMLVYALTAGLCSTAVMAFAARFQKFGVAGISLFGAVTHNIVQWLLALLMLGSGVCVYLPFLLLAALVTGVLLAFLVYGIASRCQIEFH